MLRKEITQTFQSIEEFVEEYMNNHSVEECLEQYTTLQEEYGLDDKKMIIPREKNYESIKTVLLTEYADCPLIQLLLQQSEKIKHHEQCCYKDAMMKVMRQRE